MNILKKLLRISPLFFFGSLILNPLVLHADGLDNWNWRPLFQGNSLNGVAYGNSTFVAVGGGGTILTSPDGVTWKSSNISHWLNGVAYGNSTFVAVGGSGIILTSPDGVTWTTRTSETSNDLKGVTYGNSTFVVVGDGILTSPDGVTWTTRSSGQNNGVDLAYGNNTFVVVGVIGGLKYHYPLILTSPDGVTWKSSNISHWLNGVAYGNSTFVAVGGSGTILTSPDGVTWTTRTSGTSYSLLGVAYGNSTFVAVGGSGTILTSPDGVTWTTRTSGTSYSLLERVAYGNSTFVAVGDGGTILQSDYYDMVDTASPYLSIMSHTDGQRVSTSSITLSGTASELGRGDNGIQEVTVNGSRANNDTAAGSGTANWSRELTVSSGANSITVIAYDNSSYHNQTSTTITIYYDSTATETISTPGTPNFTPTAPPNGIGFIGSSYTFTTSGSISSLGHPVEYQFDLLGEYTIVSDWGPANQSMTWNVPGIYFVRARARCIQDQSVVSFWSQTLTVRILPPAPPVDNPPFGYFDIPLPDSTISSVVQVGGWALDDVGVTKVELRSDIAFWPYIGDLYYTCGTRPDVEAIYPSYPNNNCAGWGYMWLTSSMSETVDPQTGQRLEGTTHQFYLRVYDTAGHFVDIGHRNLMFSNDASVKPFGAMDMPLAGAIVSGQVTMSGWALAKWGRRITQAQVRLDEVVVGQATYGLHWPDLSQVFPLSVYPYSEDAAYAYSLDTTLYPNGQHALDVVVYDEAGNLAGIGSRYIYIQN